ncbi:hypothetical protein GCM10023214_56110 [Amycolatopsis dongchuanensis]|uniref:Uncharacterized protein n=1 Tax=Amycolatopsis dongchuanensis TaxID=1070866 RepID=A0ABP8VDN3_9PSEU
MGNREVRQMRTAVRRLVGQRAGGPSGEDSQAWSRILAAILLSPGKSAPRPPLIATPFGVVTLPVLPASHAHGNEPRFG